MSHWAEFCVSVSMIHFIIQIFETPTICQTLLAAGASAIDDTDELLAFMKSTFWYECFIIRQFINKYAMMCSKLSNLDRVLWCACCRRMHCIEYTLITCYRKTYQLGEGVVHLAAATSGLMPSGKTRDQ